MMNTTMLAGFNVCVRNVSKRQTKILVSISPVPSRKFTTKSKIIVQKPVVEIGGDEMSKIVSDQIKQKLIIPYVNLERDYYDCSLTNRKKTGNEVVEEAATALLKFNVGIKCSTITPPNGDGKKEQSYPTPNSVFERVLNGTQFRESLVCKNINKFVPKWSKPIIICRHTGPPLQPQDEEVKKEQNLKELTLKENTASIKAFAESCFNMALERKFPLYFTSKYTQLKKLDAMFHDIFSDLYKTKYQRLFDRVKISYEHKLVDDMADDTTKTTGGFVWAMKSYDCELLSNLIERCVGSSAMMVHMLKSRDGKTILTQPAHGSITKHYKRHLKGKQTSTNPISSIFAWTRGLQQRAKLDCNYDLLEFAELLEQCSLATIEEGNLTKDLALCVYGPDLKESDFVKTNDFIEAVARKVELNITKIFPREKATTAY